jgi:CRP/FNR family transcriptional regulator
MSVTVDSRRERLERAVKRIPMFRGLAAEDLERLIAVSSLETYDRGDFLWRAGDPAERLTVLVTGRVKIVGHAEAGDVILELFGPGEPVGAIAVYNYIPYPASAVCMEPVTLLAVARRDYFELLDRYPEFARSLIRELTRLVVSLTQKLEEMRGQRVEVRIAQLFLNLAERMGKPGKGGSIEIPIALTRREVADLVGSTTETAIRTLSRWGREGILVSGEKRFVLPSRDRLQAIADGSGDR